MNREQFVTMLITKLYETPCGENIVFEDGSIITEEMLCKILDAIKGYDYVDWRTRI